MFSTAYLKWCVLNSEDKYHQDSSLSPTMSKWYYDFPNYDDFIH